MYNFTLSDNNILSAKDGASGEEMAIADEICWYHEYNNLVIALSVDKEFSRVIAVYDGQSGGTRNTIRYCEKVDVEVVNVLAKEGE